MSENILKELCNKVLSLFRQTETEKENAKDVACNRLRVVLMQDRTNLTPELLQRMRRELVELLSRYVEMDKDALELNYDQEGDQMALMLSIPVIRAKDEAEIEEALKAEDEKEAEENSEESDSENEENSSESEVEISEEDENKSEDDATEENASEFEITEADENSHEDEENSETENNNQSFEDNENMNN